MNKLNPISSSTRQIQEELQKIKASGVVLPRGMRSATVSAREMQNSLQNPESLRRDVLQDTLQRWGAREGSGNPEFDAIQRNNSALMSAMGRSRRISSMRRTSATGGTNDIALAIPRFYDPLEYWDLSGLPWNMADEGHRHKLHKWLRLYYATHWLIPILIDIFTRFPLVGSHLSGKDEKLNDWFESAFFDDLKYEDFMVSLGREVFTVGEAFPLGSFNEDLGTWEREELLNPEDIIIENFPLLGASQCKVVPPEYLSRLATSKSPPEQYKQLEINYPELIPYLKRKEPFPVSDVLLRQIAFKITDWDDHGTPILLRGLRTLLHQEKLLASQDAIAERLYSPLILAKLGAGADVMGDEFGPWIPTPDQLDSFRDDMDVALSADFRLMVYHYALEVENVFGREQVPDLWNDFDRIDRWLMQIFGLQGILGTGGNSTPYATSALNAEFLNQMLRTWQMQLKNHMKFRMEVVAEAQGFYDYERKGSTRIPIMEEVIEWDDDGNPHIVEKNKLLTPDLEMSDLNLRDEATERQFMMALRSMGVPISDQHLMIGVQFEFPDTLDEMSDEMVQKTVAQQMAKLQTYKILRAQGLSIPPDLKAEIEGAPPEGGMGPGGPGGPEGGMGGGMGGPPPMGGGGMGGGIVMPPPPPGMGGMGMGMGMLPGVGGAPPYGPLNPGGAGTVPGISNERRPGMPRMQSLAHLPFKIAGITEEELEEWKYLQDPEIDARIASSKQQIDDIEFRKKMRRTARENRILRQSTQEEFDTDYFKWTRGQMLRTSSVGEKVIIDRVTPLMRRRILNELDV